MFLFQYATKQSQAAAESATDGAGKDIMRACPLFQPTRKQLESFAALPKEKYNAALDILKALNKTIEPGNPATKERVTDLLKNEKKIAGIISNPALIKEQLKPALSSFYVISESASLLSKPKAERTTYVKEKWDGLVGSIGLKMSPAQSSAIAADDRLLLKFRRNMMEMSSIMHDLAADSSFRPRDDGEIHPPSISEQLANPQAWGRFVEDPLKCAMSLKGLDKETKGKLKAKADDLSDARPAMVPKKLA